jgi:hypothetical protein
MTPIQLADDKEIALAGAIVTILEHCCDEYTLNEAALIPIGVCCRVISYYLDVVPTYRKSLIINSLIGELVAKKSQLQLK